MGIELRIKEALEHKGMTQKQLAEVTGIRPAAISSLVRCYVERLNLDHLERIAKALEIDDINELITWKKTSD
ncbi:helix-turn-helix domain-containing protein [Schinkia azotoformans]|uniref:helix-turn-helix domain-containing protein n=1 Tax=Schinkia azotoformans TaxID=1454 RepID=UPI002DB5FF35|nr:helix-turn-helix transcriptional regulator [Schinkia azotoformans]MEC1789518.1 helix-turn-helix transcriptional regulator [Schinkia azotoformans]MED4419070.1 helix-turn-helix transcriptional regulator [Schinkia azotoformans]